MLHMGLPDGNGGYVTETIVAKSGLVITFERVDSARIGRHKIVGQTDLFAVVSRCLSLIRCEPGAPLDGCRSANERGAWFE